MKKTLAVVTMAALLALGAQAALAEGVDFSGSYETKLVSQGENPDANPMLPATPITALGYGLNFRGDLTFAPTEGVAAKLRIGYLTDTTQSTEPGSFTLDRGYIDYTPNGVLSLRAGIQRLSWGTGYAWNPSNVLDGARNPFTGTDEAAGVPALRADLTLGTATAQVFLLPGDDWGTSGRALRLKASPAGVDLSAGVLSNAKNQTGYTADFAYSLSGVGLHGEAYYQTEGNPMNGNGEVFNYLVGADYNFPGGYYVALEYYHNDTAFENVTDLMTYLGMGGIVDFASVSANGGALQDHIFLRVQKSVGDNWNGQLMLIYTPNDGSIVAQPRVEYVWQQNTTFFVQGLLVQGNVDNSEANLLPLGSRVDAGVKVSF